MKAMERTLKVSEKEFMAQVLELVAHLGWKGYHTWNSRHSAEGFPDLCLVREREDGTASLCFLELKSEKGTLSYAQTEWLDILNKVPGVVAKCVKPSDWEDLVAFLGIVT